MIQGGKLLAKILQKWNNDASVWWLGSYFLQTGYFTYLSKAKTLLCPEEDTLPHYQSAAHQACLSLSGHLGNIHDIFISCGKSKNICNLIVDVKNYKCTVLYYSSI